ncbi:hypothetical protein NDU88_001909 [Pleurodeles waltl]|uniref:Uncharacterized protein n=1 Tax=Pleurodeles waltl TaxID=8319 RepID=A0AAV7WNH2_PLEWA|nr:hypothetical protein NDU88_001909 [Pleurodeles waltl]
MVRADESDVGREARPKSTFSVMGKNIELMVDLGSLYAIVPKSMWFENWPEVSLLPKYINPRGYQGAKINVLGYFVSSITFKSRNVEGKVYVADSGPLILGWAHQYDLHIVMDPHSVEKVLMVDDGSVNEILCETKDVFEEKLGELKGYVHRIKLCEGAVPVKDKVRRVPVVVRAEVKKLLNDMKENGIIEPVEAASWISPVVITRKSDGKPSFCVDLQSLNQFVATDVFPLPNINELLLLLKGGKYFSKLDLKKCI